MCITVLKKAAKDKRYHHVGTFGFLNGNLSRLFVNTIEHVLSKAKNYFSVFEPLRVL